MNADELRIRDAFEHYWLRLRMERVYLALRIYAKYVDDSIFHFPTKHRIQLKFKVLGIVAHDRILNKDRR